MREKRRVVALLPFGFDRIPEQGCDIGSIKTLDLTNSGGRGHIDFGHIITDHINAHQNEAALSQRRTNAVTNFAFTRCQFGWLGPSADMHIGTRIGFRWYTIDRTHCFTVNQYNTLIARPYIFEIALSGERLTEKLLEHLEQ